MRRYSPIIILLIAIGCVFTFSKVHKSELSALQQQKKLNTNNFNNKDIALSSIKESFNNLLNFEVSLTKKNKKEPTKNSKITTYSPILDTIKKSEVDSTPILMLDDIIKKEY